LVAKGLNIPVITTVWGSDILIVPFKNFIFRFITKNILKHSSIVTADSEEIIETMQYLFPADKYIKLQYGIDPIFPVEKKNFIYSNRLHQKLYRIDLILKEFASFSEKYPDWQLIIAATGKETENLKKITNNLNLQNKVVFTGWLTKKENDELYSKSSIYISIPTSDGTSVSLLEAMSAGCIPVVSDLPVSREWINDGLNGIIFKPGDNSFEKAICIDFNSCKEINNEKIKKYALRKNNTKEFYKLYETIIGSLKVPL
jgi:glycosyltransferase involved in cell wall biosynthesis